MKTQSRNTAEQLVLHKLLFSEQPALDITLLKREYLENEIHQEIYDGVVKSIENNKDCAVHYLIPKMQVDGDFKETMAYILDEENSLPDSVATMKKLCHMLYEDYIKNKSVEVVEDCKEDILHEDKSIYEVVDDLTNLANQQPIWEQEATFQDAILAVLDSATNVQDRAGFSSHLKEWQNKIGSFCPSEVHTITGFPSAGKSALALNLVWDMCKNGASVRYVSLEETRDKLMGRLLAKESGVPVTAFKYGLNPEQAEEVVRVGDTIKSKPFTIDTTSRTLNDIMATCLEQKRERGLDIVVIDPVSYIEFSPEPPEFEKANKIGLFALQLAQKLDCCVLLVAHVNSLAMSKDQEPSQRNVYGGQGLVKPSFSVVELRRATDDEILQGNPVPIDGYIIKVRDNAPNQIMNLNFYGEHMNFLDRKRSC